MVNDNLDINNSKLSDIRSNLTQLLEHIIVDKKYKFSGLGIVVYNTDKLSNLNTYSLQPHVNVPPSLKLNNIETLEYLERISSNEHPVHDGFIYFNEVGELTHISQYFHPLPIHDIKPNIYHGTRYHATLFGSYIDGVIFTAGITSSEYYYIFSKGKIVDSSLPEINHD